MPKNVTVKIKEIPKKPKYHDFTIVTGMWALKTKKGKTYYKSGKLNERAWEAIECYGDDTRLILKEVKKRKTEKSPSHYLFAVRQDDTYLKR
jgi:hypothetical protein